MINARPCLLTHPRDHGVSRPSGRSGSRQATMQWPWVSGPPAGSGANLYEASSRAVPVGCPIVVQLSFGDRLAQDRIYDSRRSWWFLTAEY